MTIASTFGIWPYLAVLAVVVGLIWGWRESANRKRDERLARMIADQTRQSSQKS